MKLIGLSASLECADLSALCSQAGLGIPRWDQSADKSAHSKETPYAITA
jgi:hypothetical protein